MSYWACIKWFKARSLSQSIYEDSPASHQVKVGTPTMGGMVIFGSFMVGALALGNWTLPTLWLVATTFCFWSIGLVDDVVSLRKKSNKGLSACSKFLSQVGVSLGLVWVYGIWIKPIGFGVGVLYVFLLIGTSNATNLTDGLDGLLGSVMVISLFGVGVLLLSQWMYEEVRLVYVMMASILIFLIFNWYPAKIFMGDVGSLMLGGFLAALVIVSGQWPMLVGFGAVYVIETLSVIIQVAWFKLHKKRIFLMSPLHHHFELLGWSNTVIVVMFVVLQLSFTWIQLK